jgi:TolA-binding protein
LDINIHKRQNVKNIYAAAAVAAAVIVALFIGIFTKNSTNTSKEQNSFNMDIMLSQNAEIKTVNHKEKSKITVHENGRIIVNFNDDYIGLAGRSEAVIDNSNSRKVAINLKSGKIAIKARHRIKGERLEVTAGGHRITVIGTRFIVDMSKKLKLQVLVSEGKVKVTLNDGKETFVKSGQYLEINNANEIKVSNLDKIQIESINKMLNSNVATASVATASIDMSDNEPLTSSEAAVNLHKSYDVSKDKTDVEKISVKQPRRINLKEIRSKVINGQYSEADRLLTSYLEFHPKDADAWFLLGQSKRKSGRYRESAAAFEKAAAIADADMANQIRFMLASLYQDKMGKNSMAQKILNEYINNKTGNKPLMPQALFRLARTQKALGQNLQADKTLKIIIKKYPGTQLANHAKGLLFSAGSTAKMARKH